MPFVCRSDDGGATWNDARGNLDSFRQAKRGARALVVDPTDSQHVFMGTSVGVFETSDGGRTWSQTSNGTLSVYDLALEPSSNYLYAATEEGVQRASLSNMSWESLLLADYPEPNYDRQLLGGSVVRFSRLGD